MLIRISGGNSGIAEYLENGHKQGRDMGRDQLDERVILSGDLDITDSVIDSINKDGERYLHITLAFKEDHIDRETLEAVTKDFKDFAFSAYDDDEFNFYAEAHLPKVKGYTNKQTGELVERKPHIHIVIPEKNLLSDQNLNPFGRVDQQTKFLEAFQEHANAKYGFASPKDNRRTEFTGESEMISRYKGDLFTGAGKEVKEKLLDEIISKDVRDYDQFRRIAAEAGELKTRNAGKEGEYLNIKPEKSPKGINLKDYVFSREFIEKDADEKRRILAEQTRTKYESQQAPRPTPPELAARLDEWHAVKAKELKYMNSGNRKAYADYRAADPEEKRRILDDRAAKFYTKHRKENEHDRTGREFRARENRADHDPRRSVADIADNLRAAGRNIAAARGVDRDPEQARRNVTDRRNRRVVAAVSRGLERPEIPREVEARQGPQKGRRTASAAGQHQRDHQTEKDAARAERAAEFATIRRELDARRVLAELAKTHGLRPEKYDITKGKDGGDRIKAGARNLNVSDFLTREMGMSFGESAPILRRLYAEQQTSAAREAINSIEGTPTRKRGRVASVDSMARDEAGGAVTYYTDPEKSRPALIETADRVTVLADKNARTVEAGLRLAVEKFGPNVTVTGNAEFKAQVIEAAARTGLKVSFGDSAMDQALERKRAELEAQHAAGQEYARKLDERQRRESVQQRQDEQKPGGSDRATPAKEPGRENGKKGKEYDR